jgi:hypothetical protein
MILFEFWVEAMEEMNSLTGYYCLQEQKHTANLPQIRVLVRCKTLLEVLFYSFNKKRSAFGKNSRFLHGSFAFTPT